jgi:urate oxidase
VSVVSGLENLIVLNTTSSEFWGFPRDEYTTLAETRDRMLATQVSAWWRYRGAGAEHPGTDWDAAFGLAREALLSAFTETYSYSLQQTLYAIGERIIEAVPDICEVRLALPNKHHYLVDLAPFGLPNDNEVYYPGDRPYGLIEGTVLADDAPDPGPAWS